MKKNLLKSNKGITLMSLIVTIVIMAILAGVSIRSLTGSKGLINQAKETKNAAQMKDLEEQIELAIVKAEGKSNHVTMDDVIQQLIKDGVITSESQVDQDTGTITINDYVWEGKLERYIVTDEETYYGNANMVITDANYFTFTLDESTKTATITGIKDEYAEKCYYKDIGYVAAIKDNGTYITDVVIPYEVTDDSGNKYTVNAIADNAFKINLIEVNANAYFSSFVLPNTIKSIGDYSFYNCIDLRKINIPRGVTSIENHAFYGCTNLSSINIPESVITIGNSAFNGCTSLSSINIPDGVTSIESSAFKGCTSLSSINIPDGVTSIESYAFEGCTSLSSINIPDGVTSIESYAFEGCTSLSSINIPNGVTSIEESAFEGCTSLSGINIPNGVTSIESRAFENCTNLSSINIPDSVTSIGIQAFWGCTSLRSINIPDSVTTMGGQVFQGWESSQTINCEATSVPSGWDAEWDYYDLNTARKATLNWGVSM